MQTNDARLEESTRRIALLESQVDQDDQNYLVGNFARLPAIEIIPEEGEWSGQTPVPGQEFLALENPALKAPESKMSGFAVQPQAVFENKVLPEDELMKDVDDIWDRGALESESIEELSRRNLTNLRSLNKLHKRASVKILRANKDINKDVSLMVNSKNS
jgi:hypothetical protein